MLTDTFINDTIQINLSTCLDISSYATLAIKYRKPDGTVGCWTATACPTNNECITYTTALDDLDQSGEWLIQAVVSNVGSSLHGTWASFYVHAPLLATCPPIVPTTTSPTTATPPTTSSPTTSLPTTTISTTSSPTTFYPTTPVPTTGPATTPTGTTGIPATTEIPSTTLAPTTLP